MSPISLYPHFLIPLFPDTLISSIRLVHFILLITFFTGCSEENRDGIALAEQQTKEIQSAVINRFNAMIKYSEAGELENVLMHFDTSGPGSYIDGGTRYVSLQDMIDNYRATWHIQRQDYGIPVTQIYVLSANFVLVTSSSTINTASREGVIYQPRPWSVTTLWSLKNGEWLIHSFHQSAADPVPVEEEKEENPE